MTDRITKILIIVAVAMLAGGKIFAWSGSGTVGSPYLITSRSDLETLATNVNAGNSYYDAYFKVTANISGVTTVIGTSSNSFRGNFDGNGKSIDITRTVSSNNNGLFGYVGEGANIHDINVTGTIICNASTEQIGGIVGYAKGISSSRITISNCSSNIKLSGEGKSVGGIVGKAEYTDITECKNLDDLQTSNVGNSSTGLGGIVGYSLHCNISNCRNQGNITGISSLGGIVANSWEYCNIRECENSGNITSTISNTSSYVGGIVGYITNNVHVISCFNTGDINVSGYDAGGIVGYAYYGHIIRNCGNTGAITSTCTVTSEYWGNGGIGGIIGHHFGLGSQYELTENCYNLGNVTGTGMIKVGGIAGQSYRGVKILNCCNSGIVKGYNTNYSGALVGCNNTNAYMEYSYYIHSTTHTRNEKIGTSGESTYVTNCASFEGSCSGGYTFKSPTSVTVNSSSCTRIIDALNAWIDMQPNPSDYRRWLSSSSENNCVPIIQPLCRALAPSTLTITETSDRKVTVSWENVTGASSYNLYYGVNNPASGIENVYNAEMVTSPYTAERLTNGRTYYFAIKPIGSGDYCVDNPLSPVSSDIPHCP